MYYTYDDGSGDKVTSEVLSINETVKVPAGTFTCVKIRITFSWSQEHEEYYFSPKYGIIKEVWYYNSNQSGHRWETVLRYKNF